MRALVPPLARVLASVAREHSENVRNDRPGVGRGGGAAKGGRLAARLAAKQAKAGGKGVGTMSAGLGAEPVPSRIGTGAHGGGFGGGRSGGWGSGRGGGGMDAESVKLRAMSKMGGRRAIGTAKWELYDLSNDISEEKDLAKTHPERLVGLVAIWEKMNGEMQESMF